GDNFGYVCDQRKKNSGACLGVHISSANIIQSGFGKTVFFKLPQLCLQMLNSLRQSRIFFFNMVMVVIEGDDNEHKNDSNSPPQQTTFDTRLFLDGLVNRNFFTRPMAKLD
ncbi:hypothetical protein Bbelb_447360, partial [Branchiostoma belcheri]